jgi:hypothetical protein
MASLLRKAGLHTAGEPIRSVCPVKNISTGMQKVFPWTETASFLAAMKISCSPDQGFSDVLHVQHPL